MKIVVLAGGLSHERNVSLASGCMAAQALREKGHRVAMVDLFFGLDEEKLARGLEGLYDDPIPEEWKRVSRQTPDLRQIRASRPGGGKSLVGPGVFELCSSCDLVYLGLHGACGEDGKIQAALELLGIAYTGADSLSSAIAMDKDLTKRLVSGLVTTAPWCTVEVTEENLEALVKETSLPVVVKPIDNGSSIGVYIARDREQLRGALKESLIIGGRTVLEQYVAGREFAVGILGDRALPSIEIIPKTGFYDYENKYQVGATEEICPAHIPPQWEERLRADALAVFSALGLSVYARADFIVTAEGIPHFLEINTLPGMTPTSLFPQTAAAVGLDYPQLCQEIVEQSLRVRKGGC